jgi:hypothetical protein
VAARLWLSVTSAIFAVVLIVTRWFKINFRFQANFLVRDRYAMHSVLVQCVLPEALPVCEWLTLPHAASLDPDAPVVAAAMWPVSGSTICPDAGAGARTAGHQHLRS